MPKKIISKQQIIDAAKILIANDCNPTLLAIRKQLKGKGSNSTIHKYLREWKKSCLVQDNIHATVEHSIEKQSNLEKRLQKKTSQNEYYAQELINAEKANVALKETNNQLQAQLQKIKSELHESKNINNALEQVTADIKNKLDNNDNKTINNLQRTIDDLRKELKILNETSLIALREVSTKGHEVLMQERVNSINLQTKVDSLYKELLDLKKQLSDTVLKHQIQTQTLLRQVNEQQKIIQDHIGMEKLSELVGEEVMLHFNNKPEVAYGK